MLSRFINPYNFVPFDREKGDVPENNCEKETRSETKRVTGVIEYSLMTRTPLFIPNTSNDDIFDCQLTEVGTNRINTKTDTKGNYHKSYEFSSYENLSDAEKGCKRKGSASPVIFGSEVRGMIRSMYEILTDSCLPFLDTDQILHKRISGFKDFQAGLIRRIVEEDGGVSYELYQAEDCLLRTEGANKLDTSDQNYYSRGRVGNDNRNRGKYKRRSFVQKDLKEGQKVFFKYQVRKFEKPRGNGYFFGKPLALNDGNNFRKNRNCNKSYGYLIKGEEGPEMTGDSEPQNKHCAHVFKLSRSRRNALRNITQDMQQLDDVLRVYRENNPDKKPYEEYREQLKIFKSGKGNEYFPVYYSIIKDVNQSAVFLSPALSTLETYQKTLSQIVGKKAACKTKKNLCPACSLFGMVNTETNSSKSSSVRFSDLHFEGRVKNDSNDSLDRSPKYEDITTLQELSSPKLQNLEFYLKRPAKNAQFWTYGYWVDTDGTVHLYNEEHPLKFNGRKFYWHSSRVADSPEYEDGTIIRTIRNVTVRPLSKGNVFRGKLYFDRITEEELNRLIYLLNAGEAVALNTDENPISVSKLKDSKHGYKLGMAKPLGYGSVAVHVESVKTRTVQIKDGQICIEVDSIAENSIKKEPDILSDIKEDYEKVTRFSYIQDEERDTEIRYPFVDGITEIYEWFTENHRRHYQGDRRHAESRDEKLPSGRKESYFREYMEAMKPDLSYTFTDEDPSSNTR